MGIARRTRWRQVGLLGVVCVLGCGRGLEAQAAAAGQAQAAQAPAPPTALMQAGASGPAPLAPGVQAALGVEPLLAKLSDLKAQGQGDSVAALTVRQQLLERVMRASFQVDAVLGHIDTEASYASEDHYVLQAKQQHQAAVLNLVTFAASGALGAAGGSMQLTHGLNHAGTALSAASGSTALVLSAVQLKGTNPKLPVRSPYNMLAEVLDAKPNEVSRYPPLVMAYLQAPRAGHAASLQQGLSEAWGRLGRLQTGAKGSGASLEAVTADRNTGRKETADELADREAMLHDLHAAVILLRTDLEQVLDAVGGEGQTVEGRQ